MKIVYEQIFKSDKKQNLAFVLKLWTDTNNECTCLVTQENCV